MKLRVLLRVIFMKDSCGLDQYGVNGNDKKWMELEYNLGVN